MAYNYSEQLNELEAWKILPILRAIYQECQDTDDMLLDIYAYGIIRERLKKLCVICERSFLANAQKNILKNNIYKKGK